MLVRGATTLGEGFHRRRGEPHAEVEALRAAGPENVAGATAYVSLEPCDHEGLTPPCSRALIEAAVARVVVGAPEPHGKASGGAARLRAAGIAVEFADDMWAHDLVEDFRIAGAAQRPYVRVKMAASLDGYVAAHPGAHWLTGDRAREFVRELRASYDAVMVGAGTVRADDPQLTVRPPRARRKPYVRVVACGREAPPATRRIFALEEGYAPTIVLAPAGARERFAPLEAAANVIYAGAADAQTLDLAAGLEALKATGISSVLCEGGPTLAGALLEARLADRLDWLVAPVLLAGERAVPAVAGKAATAASFRFDRAERLGDDVWLSAALR